MENNNERYLYFLLESKNPVYLKDQRVLDIVRKYPHFEINDKNQDSFVETLNSFLRDNESAQKMFVIIDFDNIDSDTQKRLSCLVKDKTYQTLELTDSCKIVVTGKNDCINKEILGLLVVIDV